MGWTQHTVVPSRQRQTAFDASDSTSEFLRIDPPMTCPTPSWPAVTPNLTTTRRQWLRLGLGSGLACALPNLLSGCAGANGLSAPWTDRVIDLLNGRDISPQDLLQQAGGCRFLLLEIGRASCRERVS
jgi:hypothetical protein